MTKRWIGTSGFSYAEWKPSFYPKELKPDGFLSFYAERMNAVEIDGTFYRMPNRKTLESWRETTPEDFRFTIKASQKITHWERLKLPSDALDYLLSVVPTLGQRLGVMLYQLGPQFPCKLDRLEAFLDRIAEAKLPSVFEFRHESWFAPEVYRALEKHGVGLCINEGDEGCTPVEVTAPLTYLRLRRSDYATIGLESWQRRIESWTREGTEVFCFIKHEENPDAPHIAVDFAKSFEAVPA